MRCLASHPPARLSLAASARRLRRTHAAASGSPASEPLPSEWASLETLLLEALRERRLPETVAACRPLLTTAFLTHLSERLDLTGEAELDELCGRVLALTESAFEEPEAEAGLVGTSARSLLELALSAEAEVDGEELARRWAALAWWGEGQQQALAGESGEARRRAATELLGRAPLAAAQAAEMQSASREERILTVLLTLEAGAERRAGVREAVTPAPPGEADSGEGDEQLSTTPLLLLQAIDYALMMRGRVEARALPGPAPDESALRELREAVLDELA